MLLENPPVPDALIVPPDVIAPVTDRLVSVPTLVKLLAVTPLASVAPLNVPAGATTTAVLSAEILPYASVVITGIAVELPADVAPGPVDVKLMLLPEIVTLPALVLVYTPYGALLLQNTPEVVLMLAAVTSPLAVIDDIL